MNNWKHGRKILLGITGGIAAYKIPSLVRLIRKADCEVEIIMTDFAKNFVTPMTLSTLSGRKVYTDLDFDFTIPHIKLTQWADVFVIAPCTANTLAKFASGISDNLLTSAFTAVNNKIPMLLFPAMNENMFDSKAAQKNLKTLSEYGVKIINPSEGELACGISGKGRMPEPEEIFLEIMRALCPVKDLTGKKVLVTAGATHEYIDPVRYISNPSSGKMGAAMARSAWYRGADVKIIANSVSASLYDFEFVKVTTALDMLEAVKKNFEWADYIVKAAAVGDYRAKEIHTHKIKREGKDNFTLELIQNPDIASEVGKMKAEFENLSPLKNGRLSSNRILIGFAAETDNIIKNARSKLKRKNLDYILVNDILAENSGFQSDTNTLRLISRNHKDEKVFTGLKEDIAFEVWDNVIN